MPANDEELRESIRLEIESIMDDVDEEIESIMDDVDELCTKLSALKYEIRALQDDN